MAQTTFQLAFLFERKSKVQLSYREIASKCGATRRTAINRIKRDLENGYIFREKTTYKCRKYKRLLDGKNVYRLTQKGRAALGRKPPRKERERQKDSDLIAALKEWMLSPSSKRKNIFKRVLQLCPPWWARDPKTLEKTLFLLRGKVLKGDRLRSPLRWISSCLKDQGVGFRRKWAQRYSKMCSCVASATSSCSEVLASCSPYQAEGVANLAALAKKGLDISEEAMRLLLRKGFDQLALSAKVLLRIKKKREIESLNGFLGWLVSLQDPFSIFQKPALANKQG